VGVGREAVFFASEIHPLLASMLPPLPTNTTTINCQAARHICSSVYRSSTRELFRNIHAASTEIGRINNKKHEPNETAILFSE
jgi:hypothetical protein